MKLHYYKILLFSIPLNILEHNKNKPCITPYTPNTTSRVLSECDIQTLIYDNDPEMRSVKENFDRQTSKRFEEYDERMKDKRKKCKEQCEKDIQQIILKDKAEKSLEEKIEKGCLKCGCGLGGVAASVGIIGPIAVNEWTKAALLAAILAAEKAGAAEGAFKGAAAGLGKFIAGMKSELGVHKIAGQPLESLFTAKTYTNFPDLPNAIYMQYSKTCIESSTPFYDPSNSMCPIILKVGLAQGPDKVPVSTQAAIGKKVTEIISGAEEFAAEVTKTATKESTATFISEKTGVVKATYAICQTAIIASVVAILIIVLIMLIIYLILRYRRKKKMKKKAQYTKLLNE